MRRWENRKRALDLENDLFETSENKRISQIDRWINVIRLRFLWIQGRPEKPLQLITRILVILSILYFLSMVSFKHLNSAQEKLQTSPAQVTNLTEVQVFLINQEPVKEEVKEPVKEKVKEPVNEEVKDTSKRGDFRRIPRIIHQTYKSTAVPVKVRPLIKSWQDKNPNWTYRFYTDVDCLSFVQKEFPEYLEAYKSLSKPVERSDFFRYMILLRFGGVYADLDTECRRSFDEFIQPTDSLIAGWESDFPDEATRIKMRFARQQQILQWVFAAEAGHPVLKEICDFISKNAESVFSEIENYNTLEKTGPGIWTDIVLRHSDKDPQIRILPKSAFGVQPFKYNGLGPDSHLLIVFHHFLGSWKEKQWADRCRFPYINCKKPEMKSISPEIRDLYPVSVNFDPAFILMVYPASHGPFIGSADVSLLLTLRGQWQAGNPEPEGTRVVDIIAHCFEDLVENKTFVDLGAGLGFFSLAVASRNYPVIAFEEPGLGAIALKSSVLKNNLSRFVHFSSSVVDLVKELNDRVEENGGAGIRALRIGYTGWSSWESSNGLELIKKANPQTLFIEFSPWKMKESNISNPVDILREIHHLGYLKVEFTGEACDREKERFSEFKENDEEQSVHSDWCTVMNGNFAESLQIDDDEKTAPENIVFYK